jgi:hypothetical protein
LASRPISRRWRSSTVVASWPSTIRSGHRARQSRSNVNDPGPYGWQDCAVTSDQYDDDRRLLSICIPSSGRPDRLRACAESLPTATSRPLELRILGSGPELSEPRSMGCRSNRSSNAHGPVVTVGGADSALMLRSTPTWSSMPSSPTTPAATAGRPSVFPPART